MAATAATICITADTTALRRALERIERRVERYLRQGRGGKCKRRLPTGREVEEMLARLPALTLTVKGGHDR